MRETAARAAQRAPWYAAPASGGKARYAFRGRSLPFQPHNFRWHAAPLLVYASGVAGNQQSLRPGRVGRARRLVRLVRVSGPATATVVVIWLLPTLGTLALLAVASRVQGFVKSVSVFGPVMMVAAFAVLGGTAILPAYVVSIFAGFMFDYPVGLATSLAAAGAAAMVGYTLSGRFSGRRVMEAIEANPRWHAIHGALVGGGFWKTLLIVALLRMSPVPPFSVTNLALASFHVRRWPFLIGTVAGIFPQAAALTLIGDRLNELDLRASVAHKPWLLVMGAAGLGLALFVITRLAVRALAKLTEGEEGAAAAGAALATRQGAPDSAAAV